MKFDLLVIANPVWETAGFVPSLPLDGSTGSGVLPSDRSLPSSGPTQVSDGGGSALNSACALSLSGRAVLAVGRVGDDEAGHAAVLALLRHGVETRIGISPGRATKCNALYVEQGTGATAFQAFLPPMTVPPWEEDVTDLTSARILLLDRLAAAAPGWLAARRAVAGLWNAYTRNGPFGTARSADRFEAALPFLDYLQVPERSREDEVTPVTGPIAPGKIHRPQALSRISEDDVARLLSSGLRILVRTRGAEGAVIHPSSEASPGERIIVVPARPTRVLDPTGAGDAFAAGFLEGFLRGWDPEKAGALAADWAARACRHLGARGWLDHEPPAA